MLKTMLYFSEKQSFKMALIFYIYFMKNFNFLISAQFITYNAVQKS